MADSIVSCPSCGKQYRIRDESTSRTFICTACGGEVSAGPAPAQARPAGKARPTAARPAGKARARKARAATGAPAGGLKRTRGASERPQRRQREGAPPPKQNTWLYVGLGGLVVVALAVIVIIVMNSDDKPVTPPPDLANAGETDPTGNDAPPSDDPPPMSNRPEALREKPEEEIDLGEPMEAPVKKPEEEPDRVEKVDRTVDENETDPYKMSKVALRAKSYSWYVENDHFKHLDDTPADLRQEIDKLCATIVNFDAGSDGLDAEARLIEIGKPAVPRVLLAFSKAGDLSEHKGRSNACVVDRTLHGICGDHSKTDELKPFHQPKKSTILKTANYWCVWWFTAGHKMDVFLEEEPEEEEE